MNICSHMQNIHQVVKNGRYVNEYYFESEIYPRLSNRENVIITAETTMDCFEKYCFENNIDVFNNRSIDSIVAVAMATKMGNISLLEELIRRLGTEILNRCDRNYFTPLLIVCHETRVKGGIYSIELLCKGTKKLIELGANPNAFSSEGHTPLSTSALKAENILLTQLLLQNHGKVPASCMAHLRDASSIKDNINEAFIKMNNSDADQLKTYYNIFFE